jgi:hypothetical protein
VSVQKFGSRCLAFIKSSIVTNGGVCFDFFVETKNMQPGVQTKK